ncbi:MAG: DinB family protein [Acidobacteriaceae bacterium]
MKKKILAVLSATVIAAVALVAAPRLQAQSNTNSATANSAPSPASVVDQLLSMVEEELVPLAEAMPADKYNFAPTNGNFKGVRTFGQQVKHVTMANYWMFGSAASMKPTNMPKMADLKTKDQIVQALKDSFAFAHQAIATLNGDNALEQVKPVDGIKTRAGIMLFAVIHMNDHFGQMVEYVRMNGIVPPSSRPRKK